MTASPDLLVAAFVGDARIAHGPLGQALDLIHAAAAGNLRPVTIDLATGRTVDLDLRGSPREARARLASPAPPEAGAEAETEARGRGRPKLGVTPREVTLLPRHWDWLAARPGGVSVALRKLVEAGMRENEGPDRARAAKDATYRFMTTLAGNQPGYEEATRMLFAGDWTAFEAAVSAWPRDVRKTALAMAEGAWRNGGG